jgi:hypothetical protein
MHITFRISKQKKNLSAIFSKAAFVESLLEGTPHISNALIQREKRHARS